MAEKPFGLLIGYQMSLLCRKPLVEKSSGLLIGYQASLLCQNLLPIPE
ncbi:MAG: hypothetical protein IKE43_00035 [Coriobacteriales bacterium]|nr:hypothetical protein [Coriobacteriales bacterium]